MFVPKIFYLSGNLTQVFGGSVVAMAYRLDGIQCNVSSCDTFCITETSELFEIADILLAKTYTQAMHMNLPLSNGIALNFLGNMHGVKETFVYCEALIVAQLAQCNQWQLNDIELAQLGTMVLMDIDEQLFVLYELIVMLTYLHSGADLVYLNCFTLEIKPVELRHNHQISIVQIPCVDAFDLSAASRFVTHGLSAFANLSIFIPIQALAQIHRSEFDEYRSYLTNEEIEAVNYVIEENALSRAIGANGQLESNVLINYLLKRQKIPFYCHKEKLINTLDSSCFIVNSKYIYCLSWQPQK